MTPEEQAGQQAAEIEREAARAQQAGQPADPTAFTRAQEARFGNGGGE